MKRIRRMKLLSMLAEENSITKLAQEAMSEVTPPEDLTDIETNQYGYQVAEHILHNLLNELLPEIVEENLDQIIPDETIPV